MASSLLSAAPLQRKSASRDVVIEASLLRAGRTAILDNDYLEVPVMTLARAQIYDAVRGDAGDIDLVNPVGAKNRFQMGALKRTHPMLDDIEIILPRRDFGRHLGIPSSQL